MDENREDRFLNQSVLKQEGEKCPHHDAVSEEDEGCAGREYQSGDEGKKADLDVVDGNGKEHVYFASLGIDAQGPAVFYVFNGVVHVIVAHDETGKVDVVVGADGADQDGDHKNHKGIQQLVAALKHDSRQFSAPEIQKCIGLDLFVANDGLVKLPGEAVEVLRCRALRVVRTRVGEVIRHLDEEFGDFVRRHHTLLGANEHLELFPLFFVLFEERGFSHYLRLRILPPEFIDSFAVTKIKITTSQNIEIEYELASIFDRILAWLIDIVIIVVYVLIAAFVVSAALGDISSGAIALATVPGLLYHLLCEWFFRGQSVGKMAMRIKVVRVDGSPANVGNYLLRWIFRLLEVNPGMFYGSIAIGSIAFSPRGQRFGDMMAGTTVIKLDRKVSLADTILAPTREGYQALFPEVSKLDDADAGTIRDVLKQHRMEGDQSVLNACANRVCHALGITPPQTMNAEQFLRSVLKDYSHLH